MVRSLWLVIPALTLGGCAYEEVVLHHIAHVEVHQMDRTGLALTAKARIENPNGFEIRISDPDIDLFLNETFIGKARLGNGVVLEPRTSALYTIPMHTEMEGGSLMGGMLGAVLTGRAELRMKGTVRGGRGWLLQRRFPLDETYSLDLRSLR